MNISRSLFIEVVAHIKINIHVIIYHYHLYSKYDEIIKLIILKNQNEEEYFSKMLIFCCYLFIFIAFYFMINLDDSISCFLYSHVDFCLWNNSAYSIKIQNFSLSSQMQLYNRYWRFNVEKYASYKNLADEDEQKTQIHFTVNKPVQYQDASIAKNKNIASKKYYVNHDYIYITNEADNKYPAKLIKRIEEIK